MIKSAFLFVFCSVVAIYSTPILCTDFEQLTETAVRELFINISSEKKQEEDELFQKSLNRERTSIVCSSTIMALLQKAVPSELRIKSLIDYKFIDLEKYNQIFQTAFVEKSNQIFQTAFEFEPLLFLHPLKSELSLEGLNPKLKEEKETCIKLAQCVFDLVQDGKLETFDLILALIEQIRPEERLEVINLVKRFYLPNNKTHGYDGTLSNFILFIRQHYSADLESILELSMSFPKAQRTFYWQNKIIKSIKTISLEERTEVIKFAKLILENNEISHETDSLIQAIGAIKTIIRPEVVESVKKLVDKKDILTFKIIDTFKLISLFKTEETDAFLLFLELSKKNKISISDRVMNMKISNEDKVRILRAIIRIIILQKNMKNAEHIASLLETINSEVLESIENMVFRKIYNLRNVPLLIEQIENLASWSSHQRV